MSYIDLYKRVSNINGNTERDKYINNFKQSINNSFENDPSYFEVIFNDDEEYTGVRIVQNGRSSGFKVISKPDENINMGDMIKWNNKTYICYDKQPYVDIYDTGYIHECENELIWIDRFGKIQRTYAYLENKSLYTTGVQDGRNLTIPDSKINGVMQDNEINRQIIRDMRFILFNRFAYRCTLIDMSKDGLIGIVLDETDIDLTKDNLELNIANYYHNKSYSILIDNGTNLEINKNDILQINAVIKENGILMQPQPKLEYISSDNNIATVDEDGLINGIDIGGAIITVKYGDVINNININVVNNVIDNYNINIIGSDTIKLGQTIEYNIKVTNNGIDVSETVTFNNIDINLVDVIETTGNSIKLKAIKSTGEFTFSAILDIDNTITSNKNIKLKSIFG